MVAENQPGHIDQIKQTNAGAVYRLIDQLGPVSRIDLSRLAQLAPASITKIVREMARSTPGARAGNQRSKRVFKKRRNFCQTVENG